MPESLQDRLRLDPPRVAAVAQALRDIAALPDPVGEVVRGSTLANGLADPPGPRARWASSG